MSATHGLACHPNGIRGYGNPNGQVMIISLAPTKNDAMMRQPFVGETGRLLASILKAAGWSIDDVYLTNLVCTYDPARINGPNAREIAACAFRLREEIETYKPKLIITLGKEVAEYVFPRYTIGKVQGGVFWQTNVLESTHSCYVLPTYNPSAILWGASTYVHPIYRDFHKIASVVHSWLPEAPQAHVEYEVAQTVDDLQRWLFETETNAIVAVDIETAQGKDDDGVLDIFNDRLLCIAFSDGERTIVVPEQFAHNVTDWRIDDLAWLYHWGNFDVQGVARFLSVRLPIVHDTLLMSYNLDERQGVHGLKFLSREYLGAGFYEEEAHTQAKKLKGFEHVNKDVLHKYNACDAAYTARIAPILLDMMELDNVMRPYNELMIPAANAFAEIQYRGINVDMERFNELELKWYPLWLAAQKKLIDDAEALGAPAPFNPNSHPQMNRLVFDILKLESPNNKRSKKTGNLSLDKDVLEEMEGAHPYIDAILDYRQIDKIVSNYMLPIRDHMKLDGALHATTKQHGTVTARNSYVDPALQTLPNPKYTRNVRFKEFREIFIPFNSNTHVIGEADLSRAEMWGAVVYSGDEQMLKDLQTGDPHTSTAMDVLRKTKEQVTKQDRTDMKHVTFGVMYGRGEYALAKAELKCSIAVAAAFLARWKNRYKGYMAWNAAQRTVAATEGELVSLTGRKRRFKLILETDYKMLNQAVNFPIQNLASDTTLKALILLHKLLAEFDSYVLIMIHDSLVFELSKEWLHITLPLIKRTMEQVMFPGSLPIPIEQAIGPNWGKTEEIEVSLTNFVYPSTKT